MMRNPISSIGDAVGNDSPKTVDTACLCFEGENCYRGYLFSEGAWPCLQPDLIYLKVFIGAGRPSGQNCRSGICTVMAE
jgi:hypothetical protein